jgi:hypothetical protein
MIDIKWRIYDNFSGNRKGYRDYTRTKDEPKHILTRFPILAMNEKQ